MNFKALKTLRCEIKIIVCYYSKIFTDGTLKQTKLLT